MQIQRGLVKSRELAGEPVVFVHVQYVGARVGSFTVTGLTGRAYRVSAAHPVVTIDTLDLDYFSSHGDFVVL